MTGDSLAESLVERLLSRESADACAAEVLAFLRARGIQPAACAVRDAQAGEVVACHAAGVEIVAEELAASPGVIGCIAGAASTEATLGGVSFVALPLLTRPGGRVYGALLVPPGTDALAWLTQLLAARLEALELVRAGDAKTSFLASLSHEVRTPLNAMLGYTNMLLTGMGGALSEKQSGMLARVDSNCRHLLSVLNDVLDLTRIEAGRMPLTLTRFAAGDVAVDVMNELEAIFASSKLVAETSCSAEVPALHADRRKVKQILLNLVTNAIKHTPEGGTVRLVCRADGSRVAYDVVDTGAGISPADQARLFQDFQQLGGGRRGGAGGAGLGLSISRRLARLMGGELSVVSTVGSGATFTLTLPISERDSA